MIKGYSESALEQYGHRFERLLIPARRRCSSLKMSMMFFLLHQKFCWSQSAPLFSVGNDGEVDKWICQVGLPNDVKSLMRRSLSSHETSNFDVVFPPFWLNRKKFSEKNEKLCEKFLFSV